jgi:hypothetical protein
MRSQRLVWGALILLLILSGIPGVSGWTFQNWVASPASAELAPGTPVTAAYSLHFDSWMTGSTFENENTLTMSTDLANPAWTVTRIEALDDQPAIIGQVPVRQGTLVRLDGWTLSYSRKRFDLNVQLAGTIPARDQTGTITLVRVQEVTPEAKTVGGSAITRTVQVVVPTAEPTPSPAEVPITITPAGIIIITPEPQVPATEAVPTKRVTYAPGPKPLVVVGTLALLLCLVAVIRHRD